MTIATIADLEALPDGEEIVVGSTMRDRQRSRWVKEGDNFVLLSDGVTRIPVPSFETDLTAGRLSLAAGLVPVEGQIRTHAGSNTTWVAIREADSALEGGGWWWGVFNGTIYVRTERLDEPPGALSSDNPEWMGPVLPVLIRERALHLAEIQGRRATDEARVEVANLTRQRDQARSTALREVGVALEGVGEALDFASPQWTRLAALGVPMPPFPQTVIVEVRGDSRITLTPNITHHLDLPGDPVPDTRVTVTWSHEVPVTVTAPSGSCICGHVTSGRMRDAVAEAISQELADSGNWYGNRYWCPDPTHSHGWRPASAPPEVGRVASSNPMGYTVGQSIDTQVMMDSLPVGTTVRNRNGVPWTRVEGLTDEGGRRGSAFVPEGRTDRQLALRNYLGETWTIASLPEEASPSESELQGIDVVLTPEHLRLTAMRADVGSTVTIWPNITLRSSRDYILSVLPEGSAAGWAINLGIYTDSTVPDELSGRQGWWVRRSDFAEQISEVTGVRDPMADPQPGDWFSWGSRAAWYRIESVESDGEVLRPNMQVSAVGEGRGDRSETRRRVTELRNAGGQGYICLEPTSPDLPTGVQAYIARQ